MIHSLSVIIPVYKDSLGLKDTVQSLLGQDYPKSKYEIIIIDNGSLDETYNTTKELAKYYPDLIKTDIENKIQSSYAARNKGIKMARGEIICFIDSNMTVDSDYLTMLNHFFSSEQVDYAGCNVNVYSDKNTLTAKYNIMNGFPVKSYLEEYHFVPTCCLSVRRSVIKKVGVFDKRLVSGGDMEFGQRVFKEGFLQKYTEDLNINHPARYKYSSLIRKSKRVAKGIAQMKYYYKDKYDHLYKNYFKIKRYLPANPLKLFKKYRSSNVYVNILDSIPLAFFSIPIRFISLITLIKEIWRLRKSAHAQ